VRHHSWKLPLAVALACGCGGGAPRAGGGTVTRSWEAMGSVLTAAAWGQDSAAVDRALARALTALRPADSTVRDSAARVLGREVQRLSGARLAAVPDSWRDVTARGVGLDHAAELLREGGAVDSAVLDFGGLYLFYSSGGREVGIPDPDDAFRPIATLRLPRAPSGTLALRTATPDPDALTRPRARSATAVTASAAAAAVWSVALLGLGCDRALAAAGRAAVGLVCVDTGRRVWWSPDLRGRVAARGSGGGEGGASAAPAPAPAPAPGRGGVRNGSTPRSKVPGNSP
jgi:hypothetical protein